MDYDKTDNFGLSKNTVTTIVFFCVIAYQTFSLC